MRKFRWLLMAPGLVTACLLFAQAKPATKASAVRNTSYQALGERILRHQVAVDATLEESWNAFTTAEGLRSFAVPVVEFELKTGGKFHSNYRVGSKVGDPGTIYNTVLGYVPLRMMAFKIGLTDQFPAGPREAGTLFAVVEFEPLSARKTRIVLAMLGWGTGPEWDQVYEKFDWGNAYTLEKLRERFLNGPVDWQKKELKVPAEEKR